MVELSEKDIFLLYENARQTYPNECCGLLLGRSKGNRVLEIYRARNTEEIDTQRIRFLINPLELYRVENESRRRGLEILGFFHSHPDWPAVLSIEDAKMMLPGLVYIIISVDGGECSDIKGYKKQEVNDSPLEMGIKTY